LLDALQKGASKGVTRLLMAFYFRRAGNRVEGDQTFEFTHKSFGEYLTAKRLVSVIERLHDELERRRRVIDSGFDERRALEDWVKLCGPVAMDTYLFKFIVNEMMLNDRSKVAEWQKTTIQLFNYMLRNGMPMERLEPRPAYHEERRQARNAEEALLAVLNACARLTDEVSKIDWTSSTDFGDLLAHLQAYGQLRLARECLSYLDLTGCLLLMQGFYRADMRNTKFGKAQLFYAGFVNCNLQNADFSNSFCVCTDFRGADLNRADFRGAHIDEGDFRGAVLDAANLERTLLLDTSKRGKNRRNNPQRCGEVSKARSTERRQKVATYQ
jgi:hypothetical protein